MQPRSGCYNNVADSTKHRYAGASRGHPRTGGRVSAARHDPRYTRPRSVARWSWRAGASAAPSNACFRRAVPPKDFRDLSRQFAVIAARLSLHNVCFCCGRSNEMRVGGHAPPAQNEGVAAHPQPPPRPSAASVVIRRLGGTRGRYVDHLSAPRSQSHHRQKSTVPDYSEWRAPWILRHHRLARQQLPPRATRRSHRPLPAAVHSVPSAGEHVRRGLSAYSRDTFSESQVRHALLRVSARPHSHERSASLRGERRV